MSDYAIAIPLWRDGRVMAHTIVDPDFHWLRKWTWNISTTGYAKRTVWSGKTTIVWMHRVITDCPEGLEVDHINRVRLDNRLANLRNVTRSENLLNKSPYSSNTSGVTGVSYNKKNAAWVAYCNKNGRRINLGAFTDLEKAKSVVQEVRRSMGFAEH